MLTDLVCRKAVGREKEYRLSDERGLYLLVLPSGYRSWRLGYWFGKVKRRTVLGTYPEVTLQEARTKRDELRALVAKGIDPTAHRMQQDAKRLLDGAATFRAISEAWLAERKPIWSKSYYSTIEGMFKNHLLPQWGSLPMGQITKPMVVQRLKAIEGLGLRETAGRARQKVSELFDYAEALGYEVGNPGRVSAALLPNSPRLRPAITDLEQLREFLRKVEAAPAHPIAKLASRFIALTAVRPGVAQTMPWSEVHAIDPDEKIWCVPAARMKLSKTRKEQSEFDHLVPLATQAWEILQAMKSLSGFSSFVFQGINSIRRPISDSTVSQLYRSVGYRDIHVPHGWRSSFSTIMNERATRADRPGDRVVIDVMLAHVQSGVEQRYNRAAYLDRRRELAQEWADMLLEGMQPAAELVTAQRR